MNWDFGSWLRQHRKDIEQRWLTLAQELPAYASESVEQDLAPWCALVDVLSADRTEAVVEGAQEWVSREIAERGATPSELLSITEELSKTIQDLLPAEKRERINSHLNALDTALARYFASEAGTDREPGLGPDAP